LRRLLLIALFALWAALAQERATGQEGGSRGETSAQPSENKPAQESAQEENERYAGWKWANFGVLVLALGYMISKSAPQFFRARSEAIQRELAEAARMRQEAEARAARIEVRMASLDREIQHIRQEAQSEMAKERERILRDAEQHIARMRAHAEQDIEALSKRAAQRLKAEAAELAVALAEQRIRSRMSDRQEAELVYRFTRQLDRHAAARGGLRG
jgi:F-type H+-transporting ATPase subunit b